MQIASCLVFAAVLLTATPSLAHDLALSSVTISPRDNEVTLHFKLDSTIIVELLTGEKLAGEATPEDKASVARRADEFWAYFKSNFHVLEKDRICPFSEKPDSLFYNTSINRTVLTVKAHCDQRIRELQIQSTLFIGVPTTHELIAEIQKKGVLQRYFFDSRTKAARIHIDEPHQANPSRPEQAREEPESPPLGSPGWNLEHLLRLLLSRNNAYLRRP